MSRRENIITRKFKMRKVSFVSKILFIMLMVLNLIFCIYIIERNAKIMLGETSAEVNVNVADFKSTLNEKLKEINDVRINIIKEFNKYYKNKT